MKKCLWSSVAGGNAAVTEEQKANSKDGWQVDRWAGERVAGWKRWTYGWIDTYDGACVYVFTWSESIFNSSWNFFGTCISFVLKYAF